MQGERCVLVFQHDVDGGCVCIESLFTYIMIPILGRNVGSQKNGLVMGCSYEVDQTVLFPRIDPVLPTARS